MGTRIKIKRKPLWIKEAKFDIENLTTFPDPDFSKYKNMSIIDVFKKIIDKKIIDLV